MRKWVEKLPTIRFTMNTARHHWTSSILIVCEGIKTDDVQNDIHAVIHNDNFVPKITPYLKNFSNITKEIKYKVEAKLDQEMKYVDRKKKQGYCVFLGDKVCADLHSVCKAFSNKTTQFITKRDGLYII